MILMLFFNTQCHFYDEINDIVESIADSIYLEEGMFTELGVSHLVKFRLTFWKEIDYKDICFYHKIRKGCLCLYLQKYETTRNKQSLF